MSSDVLFSILKLLSFFVVVGVLGWYQLWELKKLEIARTQRENVKADSRAAE
ncbi:MAG: hypothetical protein IOC90_04085 [Methylocystis sp.]|nr:hypothetical protein [Methylocystis sp.]MCA3584442.1 hypothetical protein [Methylocystis sp.]MCA3587195.1 hypothetical protein [Methylocystis sp.]MCA3592537.1 hypothetical protein [Methylocystis sp.]